MTSPFTTRLAPSPTGALHLGNARTLALTWWWARATRSRIVLRIEDLDSPRKKPGALAELREDLEWLGLDYDREAPLQTARFERHRASMVDLLERGAAYPCVCSRRDVEEAQSAPHETPADLRYPGTCRNRGLTISSALDLAKKPVALRFRVSEGPVAFDDLVLGPEAPDVAALSGDFVIGRAGAEGDLLPGYQLAVVLDDQDDGVTHVIRGADLLLSAARQILLQRALGLSSVAYAHLPLVVGHDGRRLAKRHGDTRLSTLRRASVRAADVWRWIAGTVGRPFVSREALVAGGFEPAWVPRDVVVGPDLAGPARDGPR